MQKRKGLSATVSIAAGEIILLSDLLLSATSFLQKGRDFELDQTEVKALGGFLGGIGTDLETWLKAFDDPPPHEGQFEQALGQVKVVSRLLTLWDGNTSDFDEDMAEALSSLLSRTAENLYQWNEQAFETEENQVSEKAPACDQGGRDRKTTRRIMERFEGLEVNGYAGSLQ